MNFLDIASIVFICTAANHLGLIQAIETIVKRRLPVVGCIKCLTFWSVLLYCCGRTATRDLPAVLAIAFLSAWSAIWLDLCMGAVDHLYTRIYDALYSTADISDTDALGADDTLPDVPGYKSCGKTATYGENGTAENYQENNH